MRNSRTKTALLLMSLILSGCASQPANVAEETAPPTATTEKTAIALGNEPDANTATSLKETETITEETTVAVSEIVSSDDIMSDRTERTEQTQAPEQTETTEASTEETEEAEEDGFKDYELEEMELVDDAVVALVSSEEFQSATRSERAKMAVDLLNELATNGAGERQYPLIKKASIYYGGGDMISFEYSCGVLGGIQIMPFNPMFTERATYEGYRPQKRIFKP